MLDENLITLNSLCRESVQGNNPESSNNCQR